MNSSHSHYDPSRTDSIALTVENISKIYNSAVSKVVSLRKINFSVKKGEFVSIVGPSGSGKTTLMNIIGALDKPTSGKVFINEIDTFSLNDSQIATMRKSTNERSQTNSC